MGDEKDWTERIVGSTTESEILHFASDRGKSIDYHNDGKGFTRISSSGQRDTYRDANNSKDHDHWVNGKKVDRDYMMTIEKLARLQKAYGSEYVEDLLTNNAYVQRNKEFGLILRFN